MMLKPAAASLLTALMLSAAPALAQEAQNAAADAATAAQNAAAGAAKAVQDAATDAATAAVAKVEAAASEAAANAVNEAVDAAAPEAPAQPAAPAQAEPPAQPETPAQPEAPAEPQLVRSTYDDWTVLCLPDGSRCAMEQIGYIENGESALSMRIDKLPQGANVNGESVEAVATLLTPLGVLLQPGMKLKIDSADTLSSPYFLCQPNGCIVRAPLQAELLTSLKRGNVARMAYAIIMENEEREIIVDISLKGFTAAFGALK